MSKQYEKLKGLLKELFQLDQPDLDFGLYRIMHAKSKEITQFLDKDLLPQVKAEFARHESGETTELKEKLDKRIKMRQELGDDPDQDAEVQRLRAEITGSGSSPGQLESEVYDHLYGFFRRYYSDGDFLSKRVYKPGVYAIPYEGEEVKLHWANADQYYIKTSEYLRDYAFRLRPDDDEKPMRVHFRLADVAEGEHGNVKAAEGNDRVFILAPEYDPDDPESGAESAADDDSDDAPERHNFIEEEAGEQGEELVVRFEYRKATTKDWPESNRKGQKNPPTQKDLLEIAEVRVAAFFATKKTKPNNENWKDALAAAHTKANGEKADYSRLRANLNRYVARNTFDYFIHKDLGGFLYRELDFYIKNEVMHLDDITDETQTVLRVEQYLSKIRVIRRVAGKIIAFLAQLEDFQKKLWLKKKFVIEVNYCISLNRIPADLYAEIGSNEKQIDEWVLLFGIDAIKKDLHQPGFARPLSSEFLTVFNYLPIDTRHFSRELTDRIVSTMHQYDDASTGLVVNGENFQAVNLIGRQLQKQVSAMYLDPPYNTDAGPITYKNGFRSSSWIALFENRLSVAKSVLADESIICVTIDDFESHNLRFLLDQYFGEDRLLGVVPIKNNPAGRTGTVGFSLCHEYAYFYGSSDKARVNRLEHSDAQKARYKEKDAIGFFEWTNFRKHGGANTFRTKRPRQFYPIYVLKDQIRIPKLEWDNGKREYDVLEEPIEGEVVLWPIDSQGRERIWDFNVATAQESIPDLKVRNDTHGDTAVYRKWRLNSEGLLPQTWWDKSEYSAAEYGTNLLTRMFGHTHAFMFPKSLIAVSECLQVSGLRLKETGVAMDYFAGSGTTGHAVIHLNRIDSGKRKFILVEIGDYYHSILVARLKKAGYCSAWRNGKPGSHTEGMSQTFKYLVVESYEDALNNLEIKQTDKQSSLLESNDEMREQYMLRYMLNVETAGSPSLLNVASFNDPTAYKLKVKRPGSDETRETNVDLFETFNWLIGLTVHHLAAPQCFEGKFERDSEKRMKLKGRLKSKDDAPHWFRTVTGTTPDGRKTLVIWRKRPGGEDPEGVEQDNLVLDEWFTKQGYSSKDSEFDLIYVNGTNNLENLRTATDTWKVRLIEEDFHLLMFEGTE